MSRLSPDEQFLSFCKINVAYGHKTETHPSISLCKGLFNLYAQRLWCLLFSCICSSLAFPTQEESVRLVIGATFNLTSFVVDVNCLIFIAL